MFPLRRSLSARRVAAQLYGSAVAAARAPGFYRDMGVSDTIEGRYEMIVVHVALLLRRLGAPGAGQAKLAQAVVDYMAADLDRSMRELGVGDLSVGRFMKRLGEGLYGRAQAYAAALEDRDQAALSAALLRNVYAGVNPNGLILAAMGDYVRHQHDHLALQPIDRIASGDIEFLNPMDASNEPDTTRP